MEQLTALTDRYFAIWNETDAQRRRQLIAATWTEDASYLDPALQGAGHDGIDAMVEAVQTRFPGHRFQRTSAIDAHHDRVRFTWQLAPEAGAPVVSGIDFGIVATDGRLAAITGFFEPAADTPQR